MKRLHHGDRVNSNKKIKLSCGKPDAPVKYLDLLDGILKSFSRNIITLEDALTSLDDLVETLSRNRLKPSAADASRDLSLILRKFILRLSKCLAEPSKNYRLQACCLENLFKLIRCEILFRHKEARNKSQKPASFPIYLLEYILTALLGFPRDNSIDDSALSQIGKTPLNNSEITKSEICQSDFPENNPSLTLYEYYQKHFLLVYGDLHFYSLSALTHLLVKIDTTPRGAYNLMRLLRCFSNPEQLSKMRFSTYLMNYEEKSMSIHYESYKQMYSKCWVDFLHHYMNYMQGFQQELVDHILSQVLLHLIHPLMSTSDIFLKAFYQEKNFELSIQALCGLFYLLSKKKLGDPERIQENTMTYYEKLYTLLCSDLFFKIPSEYQEKFLRLLKLSLESKLIPLRLKILFIKKSIIISQHLPMQYIYFFLSLAFRILQQMPEQAMSLVDINQSSIETVLDEDLSFSVRQEIMNASPNLTNDSASCVSHNVAFDKMRLWEIRPLQRHYLPALAMLSQAFTTKNIKRKTEKLDPLLYQNWSLQTYCSHVIEKIIKKSQSDPLFFKDNLSTSKEDVPISESLRYLIHQI